MAHVRQQESRDALGADVKPTYPSFPKDPANTNHIKKGEKETRTPHEKYRTMKKVALLGRTPLPLVNKWASSTAFDKFITLFK